LRINPAGRAGLTLYEVAPPPPDGASGVIGTPLT
jgi:hypothetical protein